MEEEEPMDDEVISTGIDDLIVSIVCNKSSGNCSSHTVHDSSLAADDHSIDYTKITVLSIITLLTVAGNVCVIVAIFCRRVKMTRMYYFILHLSLSDLLTAFFTLLPEIVWTLTLPYFYGGDYVCRTVKFVQMIGPYLSSYVLIMTAIDRYQAICHPLSNCSWTPRRSNIMISVAWVISFLLCIPQPLIFHSDSEGIFCTAFFPPDWGLKVYVTWFAFSNFFVPLIFLIFCYGRICHAIWDNFNSKTTLTSSDSDSEPDRLTPRSVWRRLRHLVKKRDKPVQKVRMHLPTRQRNDQDNCDAAIIIEPPSSPDGPPVAFTHQQGQSGGKAPAIKPDRVQSPETSSGSEKQRNGSNDNHFSSSVGVVNPRTHSVRGISRAKLKTVKLTVVVIVGYIICSAPFICVQLWDVWGSPSQEVVESLTWLFWLLTLNSVVNPWIYMFFNTNLVDSLRHACCCLCDDGVEAGHHRHHRHNRRSTDRHSARSFKSRIFTSFGVSANTNANINHDNAGRGEAADDDEDDDEGGIVRGDQLALALGRMNMRSRSNTGGSSTDFSTVVNTTVVTLGPMTSLAAYSTESLASSRGGDVNGGHRHHPRHVLL